jgi:hypothetical protein
MNDDVLACIGQFADADARRAMGLSPNRLPPSNDGRYDYLHKMLALERHRYCWSGDNGISYCTMCIFHLEEDGTIERNVSVYSKCFSSVWQDGHWGCRIHVDQT